MRHIWVLGAFPLDLGFRWLTTGKPGTQNFSRYNTLYSFNSSLQFYPFVPKCMAPRKKLWFNLKVQSRYVSSQLESWAVVWLFESSLPLISSMWNTGPQQCTSSVNRPKKKLSTPRFKSHDTEKLENHHVSRSYASLTSYLPGLGNRIQQWRTGRCTTHWEWATCKLTTKENL